MDDYTSIPEAFVVQPQSCIQPLGLFNSRVQWRPSLPQLLLGALLTRTPLRPRVVFGDLVSASWPEAWSVGMRRGLSKDRVFFVVWSFKFPMMSLSFPAPVVCKTHWSGEVRWPLPNPFRLQQAVLSCLHSLRRDAAGFCRPGRPVAVDVHVTCLIDCKGVMLIEWVIC